MGVHRRGTGAVPRRGEARLPAVVATVVAAGLYALLPGDLLLAGRIVLPVIEVALLIALIAVNPYRMTRQSRASRAASVTLVALIAVSNLVALGRLVADLLSAHPASGAQELRAALSIWATDVLVFALAFWELDRGGPVVRTMAARRELPPADFRFSQDEDDDAVTEVAKGSSEHADWVPTFVDYLYVSVTNSSAFSPTDTMPLTSRAKTLMGTEATAALLTSLLIVAHAVGSLK